MASGEAHSKATLLLVAPCALLGFVATGELLPTLCCGLGCWTGLTINPDLDQEGISKQEWKLVRRTFGLGFLFLLYTWPYAVLHKHRGSSHWPIIGTLVRVLYFSLPFLALCWYLGYSPSLEVWAGLAWAIAGLAISDIAHWLMDILPF